MTCPGCGAALADDQRYCLNCGQRQGEPRVDFGRHLEAKDAAPDKPAPQRPQRDYAPLAAAGGIAVLGVMLLIGVLIGRGTGDSGDRSAPPQVVTVGAAPAASGANDGAGPPAAARSAGKDSGGKASKQKNTAAESSPGTGPAPVASERQLEALQGKTGQEYAEESAKLPDEIATPGQAPPADGKAPGGGSGGVTLE